ncbi:MBL fold metallo-hydrolase RNA specificity domain-containing protein [Pleionea sediminis]|uniref:MBL fold metallo-hydrolase RNA specificity domain-containing protein n=1 Tax=Pleionea sediminis TaxID=2569479 RepID=UPI001186677C|nr:MBL fold metallo-hydrolase [Pleionea sediminis]
MVYSIPTTHLTLFGAAKEVTGSCHRVAHKGKNILLDCGMKQDRRDNDYDPSEPFPFEPSEIDAVILSHAHLDHSGQLPRLVAAGFKGPIYCTAGTLGLLRILLEDSCKLYLRDIENENKRRIRAGETLLTPEYDMDDVHKTLSLCDAIPYYQTHPINSAFTFRFDNAGHILGSAIVSLILHDDDGDRTLVFSGDLGNDDTVLMRDPDVIHNADWVLMEGTYGDRDHKDSDQTLQELRDIIKQAERQGGNILVPAFAVGRTQELIFKLGQLHAEGLLKHWKVYLDSPMAKSVTEFYAQNQSQFDPLDVACMKEMQNSNLINFLPNLNIISNVEDSIAINEEKHLCLIIAGSGMCTGGRIRHHLKHRLWDSSNHLVFVGYQAHGTLGRILVNGVDRIKLFGQMIAVKAQIHTLGGFSAHAGQTQLVKWASHFQNKPPIFLVHGESNALQVLQSKLKQTLNLNVEVPAKGSTVYL